MVSGASDDQRMECDLTTSEPHEYSISDVFPTPVMLGGEKLGTFATNVAHLAIKINKLQI